MTDNKQYPDEPWKNIPHHPDIHTMTWSEAEKRSIAEFGRQMFEAGKGTDRATQPDSAAIEPNELVTRESALEAIDHVGAYNGVSNVREAREMLSAAPTTQAPQPVEPAVSQALAALKSCRTGGYRDVDGDYAKTWWFDEALVKAALAALAQPQEAAPSQDAEDAARFRAFARAALVRDDAYLDAIESGDVDKLKTMDDVQALFDFAASKSDTSTQAKEGGEHA